MRFAILKQDERAARSSSLLANHVAATAAERAVSSKQGCFSGGTWVSLLAEGCVSQKGLREYYAGWMI